MLLKISYGKVKLLVPIRHKINDDDGDDFLKCT